jgi:hypothetical protein
MQKRTTATYTDKKGYLNYLWTYTYSTHVCWICIWCTSNFIRKNCRIEWISTYGSTIKTYIKLTVTQLIITIKTHDLTFNRSKSIWSFVSKTTWIFRMLLGVHTADDYWQKDKRIKGKETAAILDYFLPPTPDFRIPFLRQYYVTTSFTNVGTSWRFTLCQRKL